MKKNKKNASSFLSISDIENGVTLNKLKIDKKAFTRFDFFKTNLKGVDTKDVFIVDKQVSKMLDDKLSGRK